MSVIFHNEQVLADASSWLARLQAKDRSTSDEIAFRRWLESDPNHSAAFEYVTNIWDRLGSIPRSAYVPEKSWLQLNRRAVLAGAVGSGVVVFGSTVPFPQGGADARVYSTAVGEQKHVSLPDHTKLLLDTNTLISVTSDSDSCIVRLQNGRINCRIAPSDRKFAFKTAEHLVVSGNSIFDLSFVENYFSMVLFQGHAIINAATGPVRLNEGDRATGLASEPLKYDRPQLASLIAWQTGHLIFKDESIEDAVKEMNRYSEVRIEIDDPTIASKKVSGGYFAGDNTNFANDLARLYPIKVRQLDNIVHLTTH